MVPSWWNHWSTISHHCHLWNFQLEIDKHWSWLYFTSMFSNNNRITRLKVRLKLGLNCIALESASTHQQHCSSSIIGLPLNQSTSSNFGSPWTPGRFPSINQQAQNWSIDQNWRLCHQTCVLIRHFLLTQFTRTKFCGFMELKGNT